MFDDALGYILQIMTLMISLGLGLLTAIQTKRLQKSQNIVSITTNYRLQRTEQIKSSCQQLFANSVPELLCEDSERALLRLEKIYDAVAQIASILHRCYEQDMELIQLSEKIYVLSYGLFQANKKTVSSPHINELTAELEGIRKIFLIKCDLYTYVEWARIKKETNGVNTKSQEWIDLYQEIKTKYGEELSTANNQLSKKENKTDV